MKEPHAKIGQQALEADFLAGAPGRLPEYFNSLPLARQPKPRGSTYLDRETCLEKRGLPLIDIAADRTERAAARCARIAKPSLSKTPLAAGHHHRAR